MTQYSAQPRRDMRRVWFSDKERGKLLRRFLREHRRRSFFGHIVTVRDRGGVLLWRYVLCAHCPGIEEYARAQALFNIKEVTGDPSAY